MSKHSATKSTRSSQGQVKLAHRFGGVGKAALESAFDGFTRNQSNPSIQMLERDNLKLEVKCDFMREDPPDVWINWPAENLRPYEQAGVLEPLDDIWASTGLDRHCHDAVSEDCRVDGTPLAIPLNVQRTNNIFYNIDVLEAAGVDPEALDTPEQFARALETVEAETDATGLALAQQNPWVTLQLWETVLMATGGADTFETVTEGNARQHRDVISTALEIVEQYKSYSPEDALYMHSGKANSRFIDGDAGFIYGGDWAVGDFQDATEFERGVDWGHAPFPGTEHIYARAGDAFLVPSQDGENEGRDDFLRHVCSGEAMSKFCAARGAIPPRLDAPMDEFSSFFERQQEDFERCSASPLTVVGPGVSSAAFIDLKMATVDFLQTGDVDATTGQLVEAFDNNVDPVA